MHIHYLYPIDRNDSNPKKWIGKVPRIETNKE